MSRAPGKVRIIAGVLKGRGLQVPRGRAVRPMRSRIRESLFSILGDRVLGACFLDVFAGSGAIGLEAISRGARHAVLVESDPQVLEILKHNVAALNVDASVQVSAFDIYQRPLPKWDPFQILFLDPPFANYDQEERDPWQLAFRLAGDELLSPGATIGLEA
ncbi:MAG: 16S rRNA (guanine(966)-N(2))-methyltransferase RsmD, partial [Planctomycetota bacterium]